MRACEFPGRGHDGLAQLGPGCLRYPSDDEPSPGLRARLSQRESYPPLGGSEASLRVSGEGARWLGTTGSRLPTLSKRR